MIKCTALWERDCIESCSEVRKWHSVWSVCGVFSENKEVKGCKGKLWSHISSWKRVSMHISTSRGVSFLVLVKILASTLEGDRCAIVDLNKSLLVKERCPRLELLDPQVGPFLRLWDFFRICPPEDCTSPRSSMLESHFPYTSPDPRYSRFKICGHFSSK